MSDLRARLIALAHDRVITAGRRDANLEMCIAAARLALDEAARMCEGLPSKPRYPTEYAAIAIRALADALSDADGK